MQTISKGKQFYLCDYVEANLFQYSQGPYFEILKD